MPFPSPGDLPDPGIEPESARWAGGFTTEPPGKLFPSIDISKVVLLRKLISPANTLKTEFAGTSWWSSGWGFVFPMQGGPGSIPDQGAGIPHTIQRGLKQFGSNGRHLLNLKNNGTRVPQALPDFSPSPVLVSKL